MRVNKFYGKDDFNRNRLFFSLLEDIGFTIQNYRFKSEHICILESNFGTYVLKKFTEKSKLTKQIWITVALGQDTSFNEYISYMPFPNGEYVIWDGKHFWGIMRYVKQGYPFQFSNRIDRKKGLVLLSKFHKANSKLSSFYPLPSYSILLRWKRRLHEFAKFKNRLNFIIDKKTINQVNHWSETSLSMLMSFNIEEYEMKNFQASQSIIHGDLAEHNFLRDTNGELFLFDFDLLSRGPLAYDYLQYAQRILCYEGWSLAQLDVYEELHAYLQQPWFLAALTFPADLLREWNHACRNGKETVLQHQDYNIQARVKFVQQIQTMI